jgi:guanosine-3',5'-bis(diphosphate) 3'-pyrophosphohydrolase
MKPDRSIACVVRAAEFAARKHRDQKRKGRNASPYINHPIELAAVLVEEGGVDDPTVLCAALLHDTIEDTATTYDELRGQFGKTVADVVSEVTDTKFLDKETRKRLQVTRAGRSSQAARLVKLADKICNLREIISNPPAGWSLDRKRQYFDWARSVVNEIRGTHVRLERRFDGLYRKRP